jgi:hypothetical protein
MITHARKEHRQTLCLLQALSSVNQREDSVGDWLVGWLVGWLISWFIPVAPTMSIGNP